MLAGTEFARTKYGNGNSYNAGDTNAFDWKRIETYATEVAYVKGLREIRNAFSPSVLPLRLLIPLTSLQVTTLLLTHLTTLLPASGQRHL